MQFKIDFDIDFDIEQCDVNNDIQFLEVKDYIKPHSKVLKLQKTRKYCTYSRGGCTCGCIAKERVPQFLKHEIKSRRTRNKTNIARCVKNGDLDDYHSSHVKTIYKRACVRNDVGIYAKKNHISYEKAIEATE
jgi:hypothetical protein